MEETGREPIVADNHWEYIDPAEVSAFVAEAQEKVTQFDTDIGRSVHEYEARFDALFDTYSAEFCEMALGSTADYAVVIRAGHKAIAAVVIRSIAFHRVTGALDLLCVFLVIHNLRASWAVVRNEVRLSRRARRRLRRWGALGIFTSQQVKQGRRFLRGRRSAVLLRFRGVARAVATSLVLVLAFSGLSAAASKGTTLLLGSSTAGWLIGPIIGALFAIAAIRPLLKSRLKTRLERASDGLVINLFGLMVIDADASTRARHESVLLADSDASGIGPSSS